MPSRHSMLHPKIFYFIMMVMVCISENICSARVLNRYVRHYEPLSYEPVSTHRGRPAGGRWKRSVGIPGDFGNLQVTFKALNRLFRLHLKRDRSSFSDDFLLVTSRGPVNASLDHMYSGHVLGKFTILLLFLFWNHIAT
ncbi:disintegrin and metalloproteinase domain-containing protein 10-like [Dermacentor variabilis]|uniref:disintegrin and metalloproteinase domain-containing protein 10-like n=1 Tax=Dermacentor variabilis TaxID=34621 RepID=UPI003F5C0549